MPIRGTLPSPGTEANTLPLLSYRDLWVVCGLVVIGLAAALGLAIAHPMSIDSLVQLGG
jgi:hypothetical protein